MHKPHYTITILAHGQCTVSKDDYGYCASFHGNTYKADAIRYVLARGGRFEFQQFQAERLGK